MERGVKGDQFVQLGLDCPPKELAALSRQAKGANGTPLFSKRNGADVAVAMHLAPSSKKVTFNEVFMEKIALWAEEMRPSIKYGYLNV